MKTRITGGTDHGPDAGCDYTGEIPNCQSSSFQNTAYVDAWGSATCTNDYQLNLDASAYNFDCHNPNYISAQIQKYITGLTGRQHTGACQPDFTEFWYCGDNTSYGAGGCTGPC